MLIEGTCTTGGGFLRHACGKPALGQCVYCGEPFCAEHGERGPDFHEVCSRSGCQAKYRDVREHREWIDEHRGANSVSMCAADDCSERMRNECQRCRLRFCTEHLSLRPVVERRGTTAEKTRLMLCAHCAARRRLWD